MATLISRATGNFTSAATWEVCDSTAELDSNSSTVAISTSNIDSATFTPGAITTSGIALKLNARLASPTGTMTVTLRNSTDATDVTSVTVNVSDLPYYLNAGSASLGLGWVFFKFSSSQLLVAGKAYLVRVVCSNTGSQVTLWRNATSNNICRQLVTTTTAAPASGDKLLGAGERLSAGSGNAFTITFDNTATTSFGPTVSGGPPEGMVIGQGCTVACGTTAATAYYLKLKGVLHITGGGTLQIGTSGTPMPSDSSFTYYADCVALVDSGMVVDSGGTLVVQGATKNHATTLTADASAAATVLTLGSTSGWANSDVIALGPGSTSITQYQMSTISTVDSATQVTVSAGISAAKRGSAPHNTEVINLTRNIKFTGASTTLRGYLSFREVCTATMRYVQFNHWGAAFTTQGKMGIDLQMMGDGTATMEYCAWGEGNNNQPNIMIHTSKTGSFYTNYCVCYKPGNRHMYSNGSSLAAIEMLNTVGIGTSDGACFLEFNLIGGGTWKFNGSVFSGMANNNAHGILLNLGASLGLQDLTGRFDDCRLTYQGSSGLAIIAGNTTGFCGTVANLNAHLNAYRGVYLYGSGVIDLTFTSPILWGNGQFGGINITGAGGSSFVRVRARDGLFASSSIVSQYGGFVVDTGTPFIEAENCTFGVVSGVYTAHVTADFVFNMSTSNAHFLDINLNNCTLASATEMTTLDADWLIDYRQQRKDGTANDHRRTRRISKTCVWSHTVDTTIYNTATPSERITPTVTSSSEKAMSGERKVHVTSGAAKTITCYVRKSEVADGAAYTGAEPRLILRANPALGITSDTVLDTAAAAVGTWEQLTGSTGVPTDNGVVTVYVDCSGSAGWINVDDFAVS